MAINENLGKMRSSTTIVKMLTETVFANLLSQSHAPSSLYYLVSRRYVGFHCPLVQPLRPIRRLQQSVVIVRAIVHGFEIVVHVLHESIRHRWQHKLRHPIILPEVGVGHVVWLRRQICGGLRHRIGLPGHLIIRDRIHLLGDLRVIDGVIVGLEWRARLEGEVGYMMAGKISTPRCRSGGLSNSTWV